MKSGSCIENWNGRNIFFVSGSNDSENAYKGTLVIDGTITKVNTNGNHIVQATESNILLGSTLISHITKLIMEQSIFREVILSISMGKLIIITAPIAAEPLQ